MSISPPGARIRAFLLSVACSSMLFFSGQQAFAHNGPGDHAHPTEITGVVNTEQALNAMLAQDAADAHAPTAQAEQKSVQSQPAAKKSFLETVSPILILLAVVAFVLSRLPKVKEIQHSKAFLRRRVLNWAPLGLTYMLLYMGRYNLKVSQHALGDLFFNGAPLMTNAGFSRIFMVGTIVYGFAFVVNGPLTDRIGGKKAILFGSGGALLMNALMALVTWRVLGEIDQTNPLPQLLSPHLVLIFSILYAGNMYFQSFGAVAIVKCNAPWFHVRERGVFGAIFGILISLGLYFAYDVGGMVKDNLPLPWVFGVPAVALGAMWIWNFFGVQDTPGGAGYEDFDLGDASSGDDGPQLGAIEVFKRMLKNPIVITMACVEFCSGFLRQAIMQWFQTFAKQTDAVLGIRDSFVNQNWGMLLCAAGILGGVIAGIISDHVFQSRRGPVATLLYGILLTLAIVLTFTFRIPAVVCWVVIIMSLAVIGVHGMLSGTASMDFGGRKNVGVAVGIVDGFVYLGTAFMSLVYSFILPSDQLDPVTNTVPAADPNNWIAWPISMIPMALIGVFLASRLWNANAKAAAIHNNK